MAGSITDVGKQSTERRSQNLSSVGYHTPCERLISLSATQNHPLCRRACVDELTIRLQQFRSRLKLVEHEGGVMHRVNHLGDHIQLCLGNVEPQIERDNQRSADIFPWI